ncbi:hypothetical protein, partial [Escherichia coli]|uniref:hypothetical protein n=1 Tax=Escherichia coli TaxID=562 RepID=UPI001A7E1057
MTIWSIAHPRLNQPPSKQLSFFMIFGSSSTELHSAIAFTSPDMTLQLNRPGFPGECFICELRLPDHRFRWKH